MLTAVDSRWLFIRTSLTFPMWARTTITFLPIRVVCKGSWLKWKSIGLRFLRYWVRILLEAGLFLILLQSGKRIKGQQVGLKFLILDFRKANSNWNEVQKKDRWPKLDDWIECQQSRRSWVWKIILLGLILRLTDIKLTMLLNMDQKNRAELNKVLKIVGYIYPLKTEVTPCQ